MDLSTAAACMHVVTSCLQRRSTPATTAITAITGCCTHLHHTEDEAHHHSQSLANELHSSRQQRMSSAVAQQRDRAGSS